MIKFVWKAFTKIVVAKKTIFLVNTSIPGEGVTEIDYRSSQTLLDADIILFTPTLDDFYTEDNRYFDESTYKGKRCLSQGDSFAVVEQVRHWKNEIFTAANAGKLVVVYLDKPEECYRYTGDKKTSGTGKNEKVTHIVAEISSYDALPIVDSYSLKTGKQMKIAESESVIAPYWNEFSKYSSYHAEIKGEFSDVLLQTKVGDRVVGAITRYKNGGAILFLPPIDFEKSKFIKENDEGDYVWTKARLQAGKKLLAAVISISKAIFTNRLASPPPDWTSGDQYRVPNESHIEGQIIDISNKLTHLEGIKNSLQQDLADAGSLRRLLFEKGTLLEEEILVSLKLMGFKAETYNDGESEFDAVFFAAEGRFIGEAEGRDNKAIGITKFSQLERNLHEDFNRDEIEEIAKGVLFGNGHRLELPGERADIFTKKCMTAAKRTGIALVQTPDMFEPTRYLLRHPEDRDYAEACRLAIANTNGEIVSFPVPPLDESTGVKSIKDG